MAGRLVRAAVGMCALLCCWQLAYAATVQDLVNQVSQASYQSFVTDLLYTHAGMSRSVVNGAQHEPAAQNVYLTMRRYGLTTRFDPFTYDGNHAKNIVGIKQGVVSPQNIYIVGAHYDSASTPGADDNASGVASVLETARILSQHDFQSTIAFIAFDYEDTSPWEVGSDIYSLAHTLDNILGMIAVDCVCVDSPTPMHGNLWGRDPLSTALKSGLAAAMTQYGGITMTISGVGDYSDHAGFEAVGKPATMLTEDGKNTALHLSTDNCDRTGYMNYAYGAAMTRGVVGYVAGVAGLVTHDKVTAPEVLD